MDTPSPSQQRSILRQVQTHGPIERSKLGLHSRSIDPENWESVLDDLVDRGLITEGSQIRRGNAHRRQKRAVIVYTMGSELVGRMHPKFEDMTPEEVQKYVNQYAPSAVAS